MPIWAEIGKMQKGSLDKEWEEEYTMQRTLDAKSLKQKRAQSIESRPKSPNDQQSVQERDKIFISFANTSILGKHCSDY